MKLSLRTFSALVQDMAATVQASAAQLLDLTVGSTLRAVLEANASVGLWMQWLILLVLRTTRAATSGGTDLDSWMADMTLSRLPASPASGIATFSRFTATTSALIPAGAMVRTADGTQTFNVSVDTSDTAWTATGNGYLLAAGITSLDVPVVARTPGSSGNVQANTISLLASAIPGIDSVNNANPFINGVDAESDDAFRQRFTNFIASRSRATPLAVGYAVSSIQQGLNYAIEENTDPAGRPLMGSFVVTVDDGSGCPSATLLSTVRTAIDAVRPVGSIFTVQPPSVITANVSLIISTTAGTAGAPIQAQVGSVISDFINGLPIGTTLPLTKIAQLAYSASSSVTNVSQIQVNGGTVDVVPSIAGVIKAGTVAVD